MNIDERLEKLTERHEALAMSLELFGKDLEAMAERSDRDERALREDLKALAVKSEAMMAAIVSSHERIDLTLTALRTLAESVEKVSDRTFDADERAWKADERAQKAFELADKNTRTVEALIRVAEGHAHRISALEMPR